MKETAGDFAGNAGETALRDALAPQFTLGRPVGRGGMGTVYHAYEPQLERDVAIKVLRPEATTSLVLARFEREAKAAARLHHRHIVPLYSVGQAAGATYFVMGFVHGESLRQILDRDRRLSTARARRILIEMSDALAFAHEHGVVHRDVKPDNVMIEADTGNAVLTDFGIAKLGVSGELTSDGMAVGTPVYMSPEQSAADPAVDGRSDVYSLGVLGYRMLAGHPPFIASHTKELIRQHAVDPPQSLRRMAPDTPADLADVVMRCLAKKPADRWPDAAALREALLATAPDEAPPSTRAWYDRLIFTYVLPLAFVVSGVAVAARVTQEAELAPATAIARAHAHATRSPPAAPAAPAPHAESGATHAFARSEVASTLRSIVMGTEPLPEFAARYYAVTYAVTIVVAVIFAITIGGIAKLTERDRVSTQTVLKRLLSPPRWYRGWFPGRDAEARPGDTRWSMPLRTGIDVAVIYHLVVVLPVLYIIIATPPAGLIDLSITRWPYVNHWWSGTVVTDRHVLLPLCCVAGAAAAFVAARRRGSTSSAAWRMANGGLASRAPSKQPLI